MADSQVGTQPVLEQVHRPLSLIPVGLKEAALDSPTFRATTTHFADQVEAVEKWLDGYMKATGKLVHEVAALEDLINTFLTRAVPPSNVSEAVLDHDYTLLAMKRHGEGCREFWFQTIIGMKKMESLVVEPIRAFLSGDLRQFKECRRVLESAQKNYDSVISRFAAQSRSKEPSSLREDAFQLHETKKMYLKASMDFCILAPAVRFALDKVLVRVFSDQWRDMKVSREMLNLKFGKWSDEMERIRGWSREMEAGERTFKRELQLARKSIEESAEVAARPSRELEDYSAATVPFLGSKGPSTVNLHSPGMPKTGKAEKQGWLFVRTLTGKPTRAVWVRRWFYVNNGIFGWLIQGSRSGGVEESEKIGVLLCNIKPAFQEDRRFCFEVKTKDSTVLLQAETQTELLEWLDVFDLAKRKALEDASNTNSQISGGAIVGDAAFAITPPSAPEFAAKYSDGHAYHGSDELAATGFDRSMTLPVPDRDGGAGISSRGSFDVSNMGRRLTSGDGEGGRDHAARIIQKLDLHRKSTAGQQMTGAATGGAGPSPVAQAAGGGGGIASLISASHNILPVYTTPAGNQLGSGAPSQVLVSDLAAALAGGLGPAGPSELFMGPSSTLAPSTLAIPPAPTNLSKSAVIVSGERGIDVGRVDKSGGMPSGLLANLWGSSNWAQLNRLDRGESSYKDGRGSVPPSPRITPADTTPATPYGAVGDENRKPGLDSDPVAPSATTVFNRRSYSPPGAHRRTVSLDVDAGRSPKPLPAIEDLPSNYPLVLKTQDAQFRMLFPNVPRKDKVLLVFRATWNPNEHQEFPGRVYVTANDIYFYSNHLGLVLVSGVSLEEISEVKAAPGKDCDFLFLHLKEGDTPGTFSRIVVKVFLEPLRLLQRRLNILVRNADSEERLGLGQLLDALLRVEEEGGERSPSLESWEDVSLNTPIDDGSALGRSASHRRERDLRARIRVDHSLLGHHTHLSDGKRITKFKLPAEPVIYEPQGMDRLAVTRQFDISPKALFHVMFGDKSAVFQTLYHERSAQRIRQGPWTPLDEGHMRRDFDYQIDYQDIFGRSRQANIVDHQIIDILNDHLCYVITDRKTPWHLPHANDFMLESKIVITYQTKSKCKLATYTRVAWSNAPRLSKGIVQKRALDDLERDALDLAAVVSDQVRRLGPQSRTKKAIHIFGQVGQHTHTSHFSNTDAALIAARRPIKQRTLTHMLWESFGSFMESAVSSLMIWTFSILRMIWKISTANGIILSLLGLSFFFNIYYNTRDTSVWWAERKAGQFMNRIGVGPNIMMSKTVYLKDIEEVFANQAEQLGEPGNKCFSTYRSVFSPTDIDAPHQLAGLSFLEPSTRATSRRLRRARQHFAAYRHDLLVAMRVVNNVEREILMAEWENWLMDETTRCIQLEEVVRENRTSTLAPNKGLKDTDTQKVLEAAKKRGVTNIKALLKAHCESCKKEQNLMRKGRIHAAFG